jgi:LacI family transcriptional regulator
VALDATKHALKREKIINKDICFVSFANLPISSYSAYPPLASVEQHPYLQGQKATDILLELINPPQEKKTATDTYCKIILESQLIEHDFK